MMPPTTSRSPGRLPCRQSTPSKQKGCSPVSSKRPSVEALADLLQRNDAPSPAKKRKLEEQKELLGTVEVAKKRTKNPGVRVHGSRVYDSENGRTCHQCRQKTRDKSAICKATWKGKPCIQHFCNNCLLNRYNERVEEVSQLQEWSCPRCRSECNCSICRKKQGLAPTGILVHAAKATGHSSVKHLLHSERSPQVDGTAMKEQLHETRKPEAHKNSPGLNKGAVKYSDSPATNMVASRATSSSPGLNMNKDVKPVKMSNGRTTSPARPAAAKQIQPKRESPKSTVAPEYALRASSESPGKSGSLSSESARKSSSPSAKRKLEVLVVEEDGDEVGQGGKSEGSGDCEGDGEERAPYQERDSPSSTEKAYKARLETLLPEGEKVTVIEGIDLEEDEVSEALQFIEFLETFAEPLEVKPGQARNVLKELARGGTVRRGSQSALVQMHVKLLTIIQEDTGGVEGAVTPSNSGEASWLSVLSKHLAGHPCPPRGWSSAPAARLHQPASPVSTTSQGSDADPDTKDRRSRSVSPVAGNDVPVEGGAEGDAEEAQEADDDVSRVVALLAEGVNGYGNLSLRQKMDLLNLLCDDTLCTGLARTYIEQTTEDSEERQREKRDEVAAARKEAKEAKEEWQKHKELEVAKRIAAFQSPSPGNVKSHEKQLRMVEKCRGKLQVANDAVAAIMGDKGDGGKLNVVRTQPVLTDPLGRTFWRLQGVHARTRTLLRGWRVTGGKELPHIAAAGPPAEESWMLFSEDQEGELEEYFRACREGAVKPPRKKAVRVEPERPMNRGGFQIYS